MSNSDGTMKRGNMTMAPTELKPEEIETSLNGMLGQLSSAQVLGLRTLVNHQRARAARLANLEARLKPRLGQDHPDIVALHAAAARTTEFARVLSVAADRKARQPKVGRDDWVVYGRVLDQERNAVAGARVRVLDKDLLLRDVLGSTGTDEHGDFFIVYRKGDLSDVWAKKPDLRVRVETDKGRVLYVSEQSIHFIAGHAEYFEIVLERSANQSGGTSRSGGTKASVVTKEPSPTPLKAPARASPRRATRRK